MKKGFRLGLTIFTAALLLLGVVVLGRILLFPARPNVVVVLIDTLRADHLSMNGYPRQTSPVIDAFAAENLNFRRAISAAPWTPASVASLFTGLYPSSHGMVPPNDRGKALKTSSRLADRWLTLAELFKQNGYSTAAVSPNPWIKKEFGYDQGFDHYIYRERAIAKEVNRSARGLLEKLIEEKKPFFLYVHYLDPHDPYTPPAPFDTMFQGPVAGRQYPDEQVKLLEQYDGEIRYVDQKLGDLLSLFKKLGLYEKTVIVVLSDHGEQFMERGHQGHGFNVYQEEVHVPLIIKAPGLKGSVEEYVSVVDVYPTLVELARLRGAPAGEGYSLLPGNGQRKTQGVLTEIKRVLNQKAFVSQAGKKLIMDFPMDLECRLPAPAPIGQAALYDLKDDPQELAPLDDQQGVDELKKFFLELYSKIQSVAEVDAKPVEMDQGTIKELESLGYM